MLLQRFDDVRQYLELDPASGLRRPRPLWGRWQRARGRRPEVHGLFTWDGPLLFALFAIDGRLVVLVDTLTLEADEALRARVREDGEGMRHFALLAGGDLLFEHRYVPRRSPIPPGVDITPHQDLTDEDFFEFVADVLGDGERRERIRSEWSRGFSV